MAGGLAALLSIGPDTTSSTRRGSEPGQILYLNPVHLTRGNITIGLERFVSLTTTVRMMLSGGTTEAYAFASAGMSRHLGRGSPVSFYLGASVFGYESPIETKVPISAPFNEFFESDQDQYYLGLYFTNGVLFRVWRRVFVTVDASAGPARNISANRWLAAWAINLNLGFPF